MSNFQEKIEEIYNKKSILNKELCSVLESFKAHLKISNVNTTEEQEYDDNNHFSVRYIESIKGIKDEDFELLDVNLSDNVIHEEFDEALSAVEKLAPSNALRLIKDSKNKYDLLSYDDVSDIIHGKLMLYCLKNDIKIDEMKLFLIAVIEALYTSTIHRPANPQTIRPFPPWW